MAEQDKPQIVVCALYKFVTLIEHTQYRQPLLDFMEANGIRGTLLLATEGINGTVAGSRAAIDALQGWFAERPAFQGIDYKESLSDNQPFYRTKVKLKKEIVTLSVEGIDPQRVVGTYVQPKEWNALISDPEVLLIDTRNDYEVGIGTFKGAINPKTESFREFPDYVKTHLDPLKHKKVAMFCTGGIRCEKSTAYLKEQGFDEVYHLQGGILKYLEEVPEQESLWQGECFVFDNRVTVNHALLPGDYQLCAGCRAPLSADDRASPHFVRGVECPHCYDKHTPEQRRRYEEREKQLQLAKARGEAHLGADAVRAAAERKAAKAARAAARQSEGPALS